MRRRCRRATDASERGPHSRAAARVPLRAMAGRTDKRHYHGHRVRLRQRFLAAGPDGVPDYELLELLLFQALPRGDAKPLAKRLLAQFRRRLRRGDQRAGGQAERGRGRRRGGGGGIENLGSGGGAADAAAHAEARRGIVMERLAGLLPRQDSRCRARAVPYPVSQRQEPRHRRRAAASRHRSTRPPSIPAK